MATWNPWDLPVDKCVLRGALTPGLAEIKNCKREHKYDRIAGYGQDSAIAIYRGRPPAGFDIVLTLLTPADYAEWQTFRAIVLTPPTLGPKAKAFDVFHPFLLELNITACVIEAVGVPENDGHGIYTVTISCVEWRRPRLALAKPDAAAAKPADTDQGDQLINKLVNQVQELAK